MTTWLVLVKEPALHEQRMIRERVPSIRVKDMRWAAFTPSLTQPVVVHADREQALRLFLERPRLDTIFEGARGGRRS